MIQVKETLTCFAFVARSTDHISLAVTLTSFKMTGEIASIDDTVWIAATIDASNETIKAKGEWKTGVTQFTSDSLWTDALTTLGITNCSWWAVALATVGESVVASFAHRTVTTDDIWFAVALAAKWLALVIKGTVNVTSTLQGTAVKVHRNGENRCTTVFWQRQLIKYF